jgi:adenine-specific DNA-methyltransferase
MGLPEPFYEDVQTTIYCGDALSILPNIPSNSVSLVLTDPPYFRTKLDYLGEKLTWDRQWKTPTAYLEWLKQMAIEWQRIMAPNASLYCFASPQMAAHVEVMLGEVFHVIQRLTWRKPPYSTKAEMSEKDALTMFFPTSEAILFCEQRGSDENALDASGYVLAERSLKTSLFSAPIAEAMAGTQTTARQVTEAIGAYGKVNHGGAVSNWLQGYNIPTKAQYDAMRGYFNALAPQESSYLCQEYEDLCQEYEDLRQEYEDLRQEYEDLRRPFFATKDRCYTDILDYKTVLAGPDKHPCEKPLPLLRDLILISSRPGDVVLDSTAGSFSTLEAARDCGRRGIGIERDARWCRRGRERLAQQVLWTEEAR